MNILVHRSKVKPYNSRNEKDIFKALWLFNLISKFLMSAPFTVSGPVGQRKFTPIRNFDINYFVRCSITLCAGFYAISQFMMQGVKLRFTQGALNCLTMTVIIIWTFLKKNEIVKFLRKFEKKEKRFKEIGIVYSYTRLRNVSIVEISSVFLIICAIYILVLDEYEDSREILMFLLFILPNIIIMLYVCQYINYVLILNDWLKNLHIYIERMYYSDSDIEMRLSYARQTFYSIWKLSDMVQKYFQFPVLCINATSFLNITAFLYRWLISTHVHLSTFFWIGANLLKLFILPFLCELCCNKDEKLRTALKKLVTFRFTKMDGRDENIVDFAIVLSHKKIEFSVCGMFKIDLNFVFATLAAVTIYVVIFKQNNVKSE